MTFTKFVFGQYEKWHDGGMGGREKTREKGRRKKKSGREGLRENEEESKYIEN